MSWVDKRRNLTDMMNDEVYVIYGESGTGKTVLASTFPKTKEEKLLYIDVQEGGTGSIPREYADKIDVVQVSNFEELDDILTDLINGYSFNEEGEKVVLKYRTIVLDTVTQMEYILKNMLKHENKKDSMTLNLWGKTKEASEFIYYLLRVLHHKTGAIVVALAHVKKIGKEDKPEYDILLPALMESAARTLCAKASHVWYTDVIDDDKIDPDTNEVIPVTKFVTTIERVPYLSTKCRKPPKFTGKIPEKIQNLTYDRFKKNVLDVIKEEK